jgi:dihydroflavonol-4-reductase
MGARVAVTGATGLLGANLVARLLESGHRVQAIRRTKNSSAHLADFDVDWVDANLADPDALLRAFDGCDAVFHVAAMVSIRRRVTPELERTNVEGTRNVLDAAARAGVPRLIHCSTVGAVGLSPDGRPCTEDSTWNFVSRGMSDGYVTTKHRAERLVRQRAAEDVDAVIVNPSFMLGPYDVRPSSGKLIINVVKGAIPGSTVGRNNFVDVRDVANGMLLAWIRGRRGERYILGGIDLSYREVFAKIAAVAGVAPPARTLPRFMARCLGWAGDAREALTCTDALVNTVTVRYGYCKDFVFSSEKAERELGYRSGPLEPAIQDALAWFRQHGYLH